MKALLVSFLLFCYSVQGEYHVQKIWLFTQTQYSGNVPVNRNGAHLRSNPVLLICYLKISRKNKSPDWETAIIGGNKYMVASEQVNDDSVAVGTLKDTHLPVTIKACADSKLVRLTLTLPGKIEKSEAWQIQLKGTLNGKSVYIRSNEPTVELSPDLMP